MSTGRIATRTRRRAMRASARVRRGHGRRSAERGQILPIFAIMVLVILGGAALVTDVAWWWMNEQRMQRAADAGALAGAVYLPGDQTRAFAAARAETVKNGYTHGSDGITVTPRRDPLNDRKLIVDVAGDVETNFARVFGMSQVPAAVTGAAEFVLPVPMGSPESYYGVFGKLRTPGGGTTQPGTATVTAEFTPGSAGSGSWNPTSGSKLGSVQAVDDTYIQTNVDQRTQWFGNVGLQGPGGLPNPTGGDDLVMPADDVRIWRCFDRRDSGVMGIRQFMLAAQPSMMVAMSSCTRELRAVVPRPYYLWRRLFERDDAAKHFKMLDAASGSVERSP